MRSNFTLIAGLACGAAAVALLVPSPVEARLFGKKAEKADFTVTMPQLPAAPPPAPPAAPNGSIYQASDGYVDL